jgi:maltose O-acetyltransferase
LLERRPKQGRRSTKRAWVEFLGEPPNLGVDRVDPVTDVTSSTVTDIMTTITERQKMLAGELYDPLDTHLVAARQRARDLCQTLNATREVEQEERRRILRELFGVGGDSVAVQPPFFCDYGSNIELGERVFFNFNCVVLDVCSVRIGAFTFFGPAVQIYTATHPFDAQQRRTAEFGRPVEIGSDVWVGGGAIVLPGVRIGSRAVIGAGSVVTRDVPQGVFASGNPCRVIRENTAESTPRRP